MRAIKIDVEIKEIYEVEISNDIDDIYRHLKCDTFDCVSINDNNTLYLDDEGLLKEPLGIFSIGEYVYSGNGLIIGLNNQGASIDCDLSLSTVDKMIDFDQFKTLPTPGFTIYHKS